MENVQVCLRVFAVKKQNFVFRTLLLTIIILNVLLLFKMHLEPKVSDKVGSLLVDSFKTSNMFIQNTYHGRSWIFLEIVNYVTRKVC